MHTEFNYQSGPDILWFQGGAPLIEAINKTEEEIVDILQNVHADTTLTTIHMYIEIAISVTALVANSFLFIIMIKHKRRYASLTMILMLAMCVDLFMVAMTFTCQPVIHVIYGYMVCYCTNSLLPKNVVLNSAMISLMGTAIASTVLFLPIQFAYRYHFVVQ
ncbi:unnamed protein product [Bursaphelenchus okinawaensis]|uniref:G_PROTEIN_RECEP_F1_2 domain-containing protein n=1 Tax=Bursaphelenchus okinawaensis TaxID=465554 RepID=A0A811KVI2_9BILA|nr:unnamed protein product [Bursaphelenchus okinawaensis]CAG9114001.1 unnamed protein product [Bursaphelenchus okinawaensis]